MTIREFLAELENCPDYKSESGEKLGYAMIDLHHVWDNYTCKGYCVKAMQYADFTPEQIHEVVRKLFRAFDDLTIEEATELGIDY